MKRRRMGKNGRRFGWLLGIIFFCLLLFLAEEQGVFDDAFSLPPAEQGGSPASAAVDAEPPEGLEVYFLDVGQGDSELIRIPSGDGVFCALIDTGEYAYADRLTNALRSLGVERIDALICSHPHTDHMGCMARIVQRFEIGEVYLPRIPDGQVPTTSAYEALLNALEKKHLTAVELHSGTEISCPEGAKFQVLAPREGEAWEDLNNYSGVLRLTYGENAFLFTGDAEKGSEAHILEDGADVSADVLKCGHHGSRTSTSAKFLKAVNPRYTVISCGLENDYGHPHKETMEKLNRLGTVIYRTDTEKTILAKSDGTRIAFTTGLTLMETE